jgi:hypothetical protein
MRNSLVNQICEFRPRQRVGRLWLAAALAIVTAALSCAGAAHAGFLKPSTGRWCALTAVGLNDCSYDTFAQCMATLSGVGGVCSENLQAPRFVEAPPPPRKRHSKRHRKVQQ